MILWASQNKWLAKYRRSGHSSRGSMGRNKSCINVSLSRCQGGGDSEQSLGPVPDSDAEVSGACSLTIKPKFSRGRDRDATQRQSRRVWSRLWTDRLDCWRLPRRKDRTGCVQHRSGRGGAAERAIVCCSGQTRRDCQRGETNRRRSKSN
jgi:hypothetical protein